MNADSRLTAYALGELDAAERETFERELAASPELQAELTALAPFCDHLMKTLPEPADMLTAAQRDDLHAALAAATSEPPRRRFTPIFLGALAASVAVVLGVALLLPRSQPPVVVARATPAPTPSVAKASPSDQVAQLQREAEGFYARGSYDLAFKRAEQILNLDRYNIPACRLMERVNLARAEFAKNESSLNSTRSRQLWQVTKGWELPARRYSGGKDLARADAAKQSPAAARAASASVGAAPASPETLTASAGAAMPPTSFEINAAAMSMSATQAPRAETATLSVESQPTIDRLAKASSNPKLVGGVASGQSFTIRENYGRQSADMEYRVPPGTEAYAAAPVNLFQAATAVPLSTFSIDVDTASYSNIRRFLVDGQRPPADAVRLEELINYFPYALPQPEGDAPFSITTEVSHAPWNDKHLLARIALKGRELVADKMPASNLVFLVDVSGSMDQPNKLPLLKRSLRELVQRLTPRDHVAIAVYAGSSGLALPSTSGRDQSRILEAIDRLEAGGSTNGGSGIQLAYDTARENFLEEGNNRVILCTDGDFNVGVTSQDELTRLIERERKSGVFLSVLGFGTGNLKDATMENLADKGNGNYAYIDSPSEGRKVLVEQMGATLFTIAKDVKIQVEFNPATVAGYRLIGYENRLLAKEDFNDDTKDAGEIGAGHTVTALYEIVPAGQSLPNDRSVDPLKYQTPAAENPKSEIQNSKSTDLFTVKLRFKAPDGDTSKLIEKVVAPDAIAFDRASKDFRFASAVAAFGMKLRADSNDATMDWNAIQKIARASLGEDPGTYRAEFLTLIEKARQLDRSGGE